MATVSYNRQSASAEKQRPVVPKIAQGRIKENRHRIMAAALKLFTTQGVHGTNIREIAEKAGISPGAIYTYDPGKEAIFWSLVSLYRARTDVWLKQESDNLKSPISKPY